MTPDQKSVLDALHLLEDAAFRAHQLDEFFTTQQISAALPAAYPHHGDATWVRDVLNSLWVQRKVLQVAPEGAPFELVDAQLVGLDSIGGGTPTSLPVEPDDVRGFDGHPWERVALYPSHVDTRYRSRVAEVGRLLSRNHQRFRMLPSTGLLRYERRPQRRPIYTIELATLRDQIAADVAAGIIHVPVTGGAPESWPLDQQVARPELSRAVQAALDALIDLLGQRNQPPRIAEFQAESLLATLAGIYSAVYRQRRDAHIVTAGVGSGKSYAFQLGTLVHAAYRTLRGQSGVGILLIYPRVVLAANQFQDLQVLVEGTGQRLGIIVPAPVLDAGGRLGEQSNGAAPVRGQKFHSIRAVYQGATPILISNLDTLANRIVHPEASAGLCESLDLVVLDEVHLLSGLYGAHSRMLLARVLLLRALWRLRGERPQDAMETLLGAVSTVRRPYLVGASATIAEPRHHLARVMDSSPEKILHVHVEMPEDTGWVHHFFLRQRPEASSQTAATNATSCLVHNRRDGLHHEYYQRTGTGAPLGLHELFNPVLPANSVEPRDTKQVHKTLGFCDSLDGVNRWADLIADNERTKASSMTTTASPTRSIPYFALFQEPLWRVVFHGDLSQRPPSWRNVAIQHYGALCRDCKRGIARTIPRLPVGLRQAQADALNLLWDHNDPNNDRSYLSQLGIKPDDLAASCFGPVVAQSQQPGLANLERCAFFQAGLCWWWSRDHLGNNRPAIIGGNTPLNGYRKPRPTTDGKYHPVNGLRVRSFTSKVDLANDNDSINDIFADRACELLRHRDFGEEIENCALVIGSPRIEVGVDLARVGDGVTFRAMRDPASLQQKVGRVGREVGSDSVIVHLVTENARDHYYFRNPRVALDPEYLQPVPLHENNRIVARNHLFMAIFDFLVLQGSGPLPGRIADDGDRLSLINDHKYQRSFGGWERKAAAVHDFLFGQHARATINRENLRTYLRELGADASDIEAAGHRNQGPAGASCSVAAGAVDVFRHEFGPNFFLTPLQIAGRQMTLATLASWPNPPPTTSLAGPPRHAEFVRTYHSGEAHKQRSYIQNVLTLPLFRRGVPVAGLPGNQPYLWTPNLFESVGREYVRVFLDSDGRQVEKAYETLNLVLGLLVPGMVTYRYGTTPVKVPVSQLGAAGLDDRQRLIKDVLLDVSDQDFYQATPCAPIQPGELPDEFPDRLQPVPVFRPRQIGVIASRSDPMPHQDGLLADDDERDFASSHLNNPLATPPRCFALRWFRLSSSANKCGPIPDRLASRYVAPGGTAVPPAVPPPLLGIFAHAEYDGALDITQFVWGVDRQFMNRSLEPARLVYRSGDAAAPGPVVLGHHFEAPGLRFQVDLQPGSRIGAFLDDVWSKQSSPVHQALLAHTLSDFIAQYARAPVDPNDPPWAEQARPSVFTVRNLRSVVWFHLLEQWHPDPTNRPAGPPRFVLDDLVGCFTPGHPRYLDRTRFDRVCRWLASVQNPASVDDRTATLRACRVHFEEACGTIQHLDAAFARRCAERLLLNSLGIAMHGAALRLSGAETENLCYFYRHHDQHLSEIFLFDSDEFGNGTADLLRRHFHVSAVERVLAAREAALGGDPDPLPTTDFVDCLEEALQECASSQASHLAFHGLPATASCLAHLDGQRHGERQVAGPLYDFIRNHLGLTSFDDLVLLQWVPEFLAHVGRYPIHGPTPLVGGTDYPTYQALESAAGFCVDGCVACVVAPEQNLHGVLAARETVSKLLLDALYREVVCGGVDPITQHVYPGSGAARTVDWAAMATTVTSNLGRTPPGVPGFSVELAGAGGNSAVTVFPATTPGGWDLVFRPDWSHAAPPSQRVRPRMPL